jgi:hypothetical protein
MARLRITITTLVLFGIVALTGITVGASAGSRATGSTPATVTFTPTATTTTVP